MYSRDNFKIDNNNDDWNGLCAKSNFKKDKNYDKVAVNNNIYKNKFVDYIIDFILDD